MFEVMLTVMMCVFLVIEGYLLYLVKGFEDSEDLGPLLERIEGKLVLTLEAIDEAVAEIEPPTVAESLAQVASMYFQGRMMDKMGIAADPQLHNVEPAPPEVWPAEEPPKSPDAEA
tara:strand:+ start:564 stop:911 length:348 start_codon:yes stop_codon:yes gene_type:complete